MLDNHTLTELRNRPLVFVESLESPSISEQDYAHLSRSLRMQDGDEITVSDGQGSWAAASLAQAPSLVSEIFFVPRPFEVSLCFAPVKNVRSDWVVQKLTELGVSHIQPFISERSVIHWDKKRAQKNYKKHLVVAREAAMQSRNVWLPSLGLLTSFSTLSESEGVESMAVADPVGESLRKQDRTICIGPEGGFSESERARYRKVSLPGGILRSETAALSAAVLAVHMQLVAQ